MSEIRLSRAQRRQMQKLADKVDRITQADRRFFERFPHGEHRIRQASQAEVEQETIIRGPLDVPAGCRLFAVIRNIRPGSRLRIMVCGAEGGEADLAEAEVREIFEMAIVGA